MIAGSIISEEDRDQLLKELAWGIPVSELSKKYGLTDDQISNQKSNNISLYLLYNNVFIIDEKFVNSMYPNIYKIALNLLRDNLVMNPENKSGFSYKGKYYSDISECVTLANKILDREGLPLLNMGLKYKLKLM